MYFCTGLDENSTYLLVGTVSQTDGHTDGPHKALFFLLHKKTREKGAESNHIPPILDTLFFFENVVNFGYFVCAFHLDP